MNNTRFFVAIASLLLLASGCAMNDVDNGSTPNLRRGVSPVFTSSFENAETRTYVDSDLYMYWTADDRLSIFTSSYNEQYRFDGQTGATGGSFSKVTTGQFVTGNPISTNYGVYPYNASTALTKEEKIELELPAVQQYAVNSFGVGANTMVAVTAGTDDFFLPFKNVCGYLVVKLYGDVTVKKVIFEGNNGEKIAGAATVVASHNSNPEITMSENATTSITIDCGEGVELGKTADTATEFWFVIPPTTFSNGFTIKAEGNGSMMMKKSTTASRTIQRNIANTMPAIEAVFDTPIEGYVVFEDANFKAYCVTNFDTDGDGKVSFAEALAVTSIDVNTNNIESMSGIEHFANLTYLACTGSYGKGGLTSLDVSKNTKLTRLICYSNQLTSLDISKNTELIALLCSFNQLTSLDVSNNKALTRLECPLNQLTSLDISKNTALTYFHCEDNQLTSLDVSKNTALTKLSCHSNQLTNLIVSNNIALTTLYCYNNRLTSLDVSKNTALKSLDCRNSALAVIWMKRGQSISSFTYDSFITTIKYVDDFEQFEAVDLGLSVMWASCNLGAMNAEEYGDYYAWGEIEPYYAPGHSQDQICTSWRIRTNPPITGYNWESYKWCNGTINSMTKYNTMLSYGNVVDQKTTLDLEDDAARANLGGSWRIPTEADYAELLDNCTTVWTVLKGVSGLLISSKKNNNSIFLPAAGHWYETGFDWYYSGPVSPGSVGLYGSSSLSTDYPYRGRGLSFTSDYIGVGNGHRFIGRSIRPVCD